MIDKELHTYAREVSEKLNNPDKKQLRYNDIVDTAKIFYNDPFEGVKELVSSCDKESTLYSKTPMTVSLNRDYGWML